ncbi:MAG TPA: NUDIX domain-containing protein [Acetobacteraceae bacterium]|jgi:ADP-ribose pyrophosphatase|nr:NUDIX domain-containing protein [Acetobacteraceae bacterium]
MASRSFPRLPEHPDVQVSSERRVWNGRFPLDEVRFRHRRFDGSLSGERTWEVWRRGRAAAVLPYDPAVDVVVLIEQFRLPALVAGLDPVLVELPAGLCDYGEEPETTARRETMEEMGLAVGAMQRIGGFLLTPGGADELCELYVGRVQAPRAGADGIAGHAGMANEHEDIRVRVWPAERAIEAALNGRLTNSVTMIGLLWLAAQRPALRKEWLEA